MYRYNYFYNACCTWNNTLEQIYLIRLFADYLNLRSLRSVKFIFIKSVKCRFLIFIRMCIVFVCFELLITRVRILITQKTYKYYLKKCSLENK